MARVVNFRVFFFKSVVVVIYWFCGVHYPQQLARFKVLVIIHTSKEWSVVLHDTCVYSALTADGSSTAVRLLPHRTIPVVDPSFRDSRAGSPTYLCEAYAAT